MSAMQRSERALARVDQPVEWRRFLPMSRLWSYLERRGEAASRSATVTPARRSKGSRSMRSFRRRRWRRLT